MNCKPHRQNTDFQLRFFLAGSCKTPDGAWSLLYGQKLDMEARLRVVEAQRLEREAKIAAAEEIGNAPDAKQSVRLQAQADIIRANAEVPLWDINIQAANDELATILKLMQELEPLRKYKDLSILEANEACQREEWLEELKERAENFLLTTGTIPYDHLSTMRNHPDFKTILVPHIRSILVSISTNSDKTNILSLLPDVKLLNND